MGGHELVVQLGRGALEPAEHPAVPFEEVQSPCLEHMIAPAHAHTLGCVGEPLAVLLGPGRIEVHGALEEQPACHGAQVGHVVASSEEPMASVVQVAPLAVEPEEAALHVGHHGVGQQRRAVQIEPVLAAESPDHLEPALGVAPLVVAAHRPSQELTDVRASERERVLGQLGSGGGVGISNAIHGLVRDSRPSAGRESHEFREMHRRAVAGTGCQTRAQKSVHAGVYSRASCGITTITSSAKVVMHAQSTAENQSTPGAHGVSIAARIATHSRSSQAGRLAAIHARAACQASSVAVVGPQTPALTLLALTTGGSMRVLAAHVLVWCLDAQAPEHSVESLASLSPLIRLTVHRSSN